MEKRSDGERDLLTAEEFNRIVAKRRIPPPAKDSPGDSAYDELFEARLGENYPEEDVPPEEEDAPLADHPAHPGAGPGSEELVPERIGVRSSH